MATIEERANLFACKGCDTRNCKRHICGCTRASYRKVDYITIATEQDRIARQEERERCIKAAQNWWCKNKCSDYKRCIHGLGNVRILAEGCSFEDELKNELEKGGNQ